LKAIGKREVERKRKGRVIKGLNSGDTPRNPFEH
jgi:hypothetical protein